MSCATNKGVPDVILMNGRVYTVNPIDPWAEAIAIRNGKIEAVGSWEDLRSLQGEQTKIIDLQGNFTMPGFIEGHGHFDLMGEMFLEVDLRGTRNWNEVVQLARVRADGLPKDAWIYGRGWHQEKWDEPPGSSYEGYPGHTALSEAIPDHPVILEHASGHGIIANALAMQKAGVSRETPDPAGGRILRDASGKPVGVFEENAADLITSRYDAYLDSLSPEDEAERWQAIITYAQDACLRNGITSFHDAGTTLESYAFYRDAASKGDLQVRLYTMLREPLKALQANLGKFPEIGYKDQLLTCRAVKVMFDGALGSYGAWLLKPYTDEPGYYGQNTTSLEALSAYADIALKYGLQLCTHAIGDRANREVLNLYEKTLKAIPNTPDVRWRIEHAQHLHPDDIPRFADLEVIAAMQAVHCTSDAPFVEKRLGKERAEHGAYAWRALLDAGAVIANGTDTPVEDVNPLHCIYASVTRKRVDDGMTFYPEQAMTREEAIRSYTIANAYAAFEEDLKGSLEPGKLADIVVLSEDIVHCALEQILSAKVLATIVGGQIRYADPALGIDTGSYD